MINKITTAQIVANGVQSLANRPNAPSRYGASGLTAPQLKKAFDNLSSILAEKINEIIDGLQKNGGETVSITLPGTDIKNLGDFLEFVTSPDFSSEVLKVYAKSGDETSVALQKYIFDVDGVLMGLAERLSDLEKKEETILSIGDKPSSYAETEKMWDIIGERPKAFGKTGSLWNAVYSMLDGLEMTQSGVSSDISDIRSSISALDAEVEAREKVLDRRVTNLEAVNRGVSYLEESVSSVAYEAPIPTHAAPWAHLDRVGSATIRKFNSILDFSMITPQTQNGITVSCNAESGVFTISGTATANVYIQFEDSFGTSGSKSNKVVRLEKVGGTMSGVGVGDCIGIANANAEGVGQMRLIDDSAEKAWASSEMQRENEIGYIYLVTSPGATFVNCKFYVGVANAENAWSLTENKPTKLRVMSKNLVPFPYKNGNGYISGTVTFTVDDDGVITAERTGETGTRAWFIMCDGAPISAGTYTMSGCIGGVLNSNYCFAITTRNNDGTVSNDTAYADGTKNFTVNNDGVMKLQIVIYENFTGKVVFKPQLERGTTATSYTKPSQIISITALPNLDDLIKDGWGQGVPSVGGNYIEFTDDGRVLYQRTTERLVLTGEEGESIQNYSENGKNGIYIHIENQSDFSLNSGTVNCVSNFGEAISREEYSILTESNVSIICVSKNYFRLYDPAWQSLDDPAATFRAECAARYAEGNPIIIEYALATPPDPIDITDRFNWDGFIEGQGNGSIIIENTAKADLPTTLTYMVSTRGG